MVLTNARIVTPTEIVTGSMEIQDGVISGIDTSSSAVGIDMEGDYILPGLIDVHTDNLERHIMPRNNAEWPVLSALVAHDAQLATAGITTVLDSLCVGVSGAGVRNFEKVQEAIHLIDSRSASNMFRSDHLLHLRAELSNEEMPAMFARVYESPRVRLVSLMDHTPGQRQWANVEKFAAMEQRDLKLTDEEVRALLERAQINHEKYSPVNRRAVLDMLQGRPVALASHDDTTLEHVEQAHAEGIGISEFPTTVVAAQAARDCGMSIVAGSPNLVLRRSHSGNVSVEELASHGLLDALSSDYAPSSLLFGAFLLHRHLGIALHESLKTVTLHPAQLVQLGDRGSLEIGKRADVIRVREVDQLPLVTTVWREGTRVA